MSHAVSLFDHSGAMLQPMDTVVIMRMSIGNTSLTECQIGHFGGSTALE